MIVTLEEVKKNLLENIEKYFTKETVFYNNFKKLLIIRDSLCKINFAFFSSAENSIQLEEIKKIISGWFQQAEMPLERFDEWLGECFIDDLEIDDLFHGVGEEVTRLDKVYWHEEALHLEDWKVLQKKLSQNEVRNDRNAKVISFYSYKGGVGRTTLCAITALELSQMNQKVVVIDTDIEAPGLAFQFFGKGGKASYTNS
jgi:hypothetical protein